MHGNSVQFDDPPPPPYRHHPNDDVTGNNASINHHHTAAAAAAAASSSHHRHHSSNNHHHHFHIDALATKHRQQLIWKTLGLSSHAGSSSSSSRRKSSSSNSFNVFEEERHALLGGHDDSHLDPDDHDDDNSSDSWSDDMDVPNDQQRNSFNHIMQRKVWKLMRSSKARKRRYWPNVFFECLILVMIVLNVTLLVMQTEPNMWSNQMQQFYVVFEAISCALFTVEYIARLWACVVDSRFSDGPIQGRIKWALRPMSLLDFFVLIPYWFDLIVTSPDTIRSLTALRFLRVVRVLSLLRLERQTCAFRRLRLVLKKKKNELLVALFLALVLFILSATVMYLVENEAQPDKFASVPASMWWAANALTSVGYGDVIPVTAEGKFIAGLVSFLGIGLFALPTGILGAGFIEATVEEIQDEIAEHERSLAQEFEDDDESVTVATTTADNLSSITDQTENNATTPSSSSLHQLRQKHDNIVSTLQVTCPHCSNLIHLQTNFSAITSATVVQC